MTYKLYIGDRTYSSWSLRGWLMFEKFNIPARTRLVGLYDGTMAEDMAHLSPAKFVPAMETSEGVVVGDSLAMAETLHERHPKAGLYPKDPTARAFCRWLVAEMHSGFHALRSECPMNLEHSWDGFTQSDALTNDLERLSLLWDEARSRHGQDGPWLFGTYSLADVFFAPAATRIATYGLAVSDTSRAYVDLQLAEISLRQWRAMGLTKDYAPKPYRLDLDVAPWPGPTSPPGKPVDAQSAQNALCPYSNKPVTHFMELDGHVWGFCNAFCRDKTVIDPGAWPQFVELHSAIVNHQD